MTKVIAAVGGSLLFLLGIAEAAQVSPRITSARGTGIVLGPSGYIVTNAHVVQDAARVEVVISGVSYLARVTASDRSADLALLTVHGGPFPEPAIGDSRALRIGDQVVAVGCPNGRCGTATVGRIANFGQSARSKEGTTLTDLLLLDITIAPGSSGGALYNMEGEVVGITVGGIGGTGFGFAIPMENVLAFLRTVSTGPWGDARGRVAKDLSVSQIADLGARATAFVEVEVVVSLWDCLPSPHDVHRVLSLLSADLGFRQGATYGLKLEVMPGSYAYEDWADIFVADDGFDLWALLGVVDLAQQSYEAVVTDCIMRTMLDLAHDFRPYDPVCRTSCDFPPGMTGCSPRCYSAQFVKHEGRIGLAPVSFGIAIRKVWFCGSSCTFAPCPYEFFGQAQEEACKRREPPTSQGTLAQGGYAVWKIQDLVFYVMLIKRFQPRWGPDFTYGKLLDQLGLLVQLTMDSAAKTIGL